VNLRNKIGLTYDDVLLVPRKGQVLSRQSVDTSTFLTNGVSISIPIVSTPMSSVTDSTVARKMAELGGGAFIHRNQSIENQANEWSVATCNNPNGRAIGCSIGTTESPSDRMSFLYERGCRLFCLDVAHAHSVSTERWYLGIPDRILYDSDLIIGSVATGEAVEWILSRFPVSAFRVGIGPGAACTTREVTGHGLPQLSAVVECVEATSGSYTHIIADGGINTSGDIVKALAAGASSVMIGRLIAGAIEAPYPGSYYGMASRRAKTEAGLAEGLVEGVESTVGIDGSLESIINSLMGGIKSGISYSGGVNIQTMQDNHEFILVSHGSNRENQVRV